jgi:hypothetical protein
MVRSYYIPGPKSQTRIYIWGYYMVPAFGVDFSNNNPRFSNFEFECTPTTIKDRHVSDTVARSS